MRFRNLNAWSDWTFKCLNEHVIEPIVVNIEDLGFPSTVCHFVTKFIKYQVFQIE